MAIGSHPPQNLLGSWVVLNIDSGGLWLYKQQLSGIRIPTPVVTVTTAMENHMKNHRKTIGKL